MAQWMFSSWTILRMAFDTCSSKYWIELGGFQYSVKDQRAQEHRREQEAEIGGADVL